MDILHITTLITFADITQAAFVVLLVKLAAYIIPFFLIPATFKAGMGAFSAVTGMLSDRSRGFFDKQRKTRQGKYDYNKARMKSGERFNNRGLNALTSRASTKNLGLGRTGSMAYQQKVNNASADFGKSAAGQAVQHNDGALQALTYGSRAAALAGLRNGDFGKKSENEIRDSIAAAEASGGFGRNRQVFAAAQLSRTGTGYDNLEQVSKTIARAANGNASQAAALAGDINASTKQSGRFDLAPGFGKLNGLAQAEMNGGAPKADYNRAAVAAARGVDPVSLLRGKPHQVQQLTQSLKEHAAASNNVMTAIDNTPPAQVTDEMRAARAAAEQEYLLTMGQMDQLDQSKGYASVENQGHVNSLMDGTNVLRTKLGDMMGTGTTGPVTIDQQVLRERWSQVKATRMSRDPNDPNAL